MEKVLKLADEISDIISNSDTYIEYINSYNKIKNNYDIMERVTKMKREHIDFAKKYRDGERDFNREKYISQEFYKLMLDKDVETYFMNEHKLVGLINEVYSRITEKCMLQIFD